MKRRKMTRSTHTLSRSTGRNEKKGQKKNETRKQRTMQTIYKTKTMRGALPITPTKGRKRNLIKEGIENN